MFIINHIEKTFSKKTKFSIMLQSTISTMDVQSYVVYLFLGKVKRWGNNGLQHGEASSNKNKVSKWIIRFEIVSTFKDMCVYIMQGKPFANLYFKYGRKFQNVTQTITMTNLNIILEMYFSRKSIRMLLIECNRVIIQMKRFSSLLY